MIDKREEGIQALEMPSPTGTQTARSMSATIVAQYASVFQAAIIWLRRGAGLLPVQRNSKFYIRGFGPHRRVIREYNAAERYFLQVGCNLGVLLPEGTWCLDFDDVELFTRWIDALPVELQLTYQEASPRGYHVFYRGELPADLQLVPGVEIKTSVLVAPSMVAGVYYTSINAGVDILKLSDSNSVLSLLRSEQPAGEPVQLERGSQPAGAGGTRQEPGGGDVVSRIKAAWSVLWYASSLTELKASPPGQKRWWIGLCPLHDDQHPSLWVDNERGSWGCFSPGCVGHQGGDLINLYALVHKIDVREAIRRLSRGLRA